MNKLNWGINDVDKNIKIVSKFIETELDSKKVSELRLFLADLIGMKRGEITSAKQCNSPLGRQVYDMIDYGGHSGSSWTYVIMSLIGATLEYLNPIIGRAARDAQLTIR